MSDRTMKLLAKPMLFAAAFFLGASFILMKGALDSIPTGHLIAIRFTAGTPMAALVSWRHRKDFHSSCLWRGGLAGLMLFGTYWAQTVGLETVVTTLAVFQRFLYSEIP